MSKKSQISLFLATLLLLAAAVQKWGDGVPFLPSPKVSEAWAVLLEETGDREPWLGALIVQAHNTDLGGNEFKTLDVTQLPDWVKLEPVDTIPCIVFIDAKTKQRLGVQPVTKQTTIAQIKGALDGYTD